MFPTIPALKFKKRSDYIQVSYETQLLPILTAIKSIAITKTKLTNICFIIKFVICFMRTKLF
jgi:hypothetical protein